MPFSLSAEPLRSRRTVDFLSDLVCVVFAYVDLYGERKQSKLGFLQDGGGVCSRTANKHCGL